MMDTKERTEAHMKLTQELRRGVLVLAVLSQLEQNKYGYALMGDLSERGLEIDQGTLYPLLRRLESQGLLQSEWSVEGSRPRRYYVLSAEGTRLLDMLKTEWRNLTNMMEGLLDGVNIGGKQNESH